LLACALAPHRRTLWTCAIVVIVPAIVAAHQPESEVADRALAFFVALPAGDVDSALKSARPSPVSVADRDADRARLPPNGALQPERAERASLATLTEVLQYHERIGIVVVTVIDVPQAFVGLHARSILLISRPAMRLVSAVELQALVAHEMGHDYFWSEYQQARERRDLRALREVELKCDGIAALTLVALGLAPTALMSAERKVRRFNETMDAVANADAYPSSSERERFIRAVIELRAGRRDQGPSRRRNEVILPSFQVRLALTSTSSTPRQSPRRAAATSSICMSRVARPAVCRS
jgi:hypothetical protein